MWFYHLNTKNWTMIVIIIVSCSEYSFQWWFWMVATGIALSCAFSCKWVGLFVILWAGITTAMELWDILGNLELSLVGFSTEIMIIGQIRNMVTCYCSWLASLVLILEHNIVFTCTRGSLVNNNSYTNRTPYFDLEYNTNILAGEKSSSPSIWKQKHYKRGPTSIVSVVEISTSLCMQLIQPKCFSLFIVLFYNYVYCNVYCQ